MIIVEGPDNSGKSTLVKHIASRYGLPTVVSAFAPRMDYVKNGKHPRMMAEVAMHFLGLLQSEAAFVADRCPLISEKVYGPILRQIDDIQDYYTPDDHVSLYEAFIDAAPVVIYCRPPMNKLFAFGDREQLAGVIENQQKLVEAYDKKMEELKEAGLDVYTYDFTDVRTMMDVEEVLDNLLLNPPQLMTEEEYEAMMEKNNEQA